MKFQHITLVLLLIFASPVAAWDPWGDITNPGRIIQNTQKTVEKAVQDTGKTVEKAAHDTGHTLEKAAQDTGTTVEKAAHDTGHTLEKAVQDTGKTIEKATHDIGHTLEKAGQDTARYIEENPEIIIAAAVIAGGVYLVVVEGWALEVKIGEAAFTVVAAAALNNNDSEEKNNLTNDTAPHKVSKTEDKPDSKQNTLDQENEVKNNASPEVPAIVVNKYEKMVFVENTIKYLKEKPVGTYTPESLPNTPTEQEIAAINGLLVLDDIGSTDTEENNNNQDVIKKTIKKIIRNKKFGSGVGILLDHENLANSTRLSPQHLNNLKKQLKSELNKYIKLRVETGKMQPDSQGAQEELDIHLN